MDFTFESGATIKVFYKEIISKADVPSSLPPGIPFTDACFMGIYSSDSYYILGDFFLRSAYAVFDLTNHRVGIAQSNLNSTTSNVVEVPAGAASIPQVTGVSMPNSSPTPTSSPISTSKPSPAPTTPTPSPSNTSKPTPNHTVPIAIGVAVPVVVIIAALIGFFLYRRRKTSQPPPASELYQSPPVQQNPQKGTATAQNQYVGAGYGGQHRLSNMSELPSPVSSPQPTYNGFHNNAMYSVNENPPSWSPTNEKTAATGYNEYHGTSGPIPDMPGR